MTDELSIGWTAPLTRLWRGVMRPPRCGIPNWRRWCGLPPTCGTTRAPTSRRACGRNWQGDRQCPPPVLTNIREGFATVTPYVWVPDRGLADFLIRVFDAVETRVTEGGRHGTHRELRIGNSMLMLVKARPVKIAPGRSMTFHVFVDDVDASYAKALAAGGESLGEPADRPYGERSGFIKDAFGNHWYIASPLGPESFGHALGTVTPFLHSRDVRGYIDFLVRAFGASEEVVHELPGGMIPYARARVGDAAIELAPPIRGPAPFCLYVADPDLVYEQAVAAGAKALWPAAD